MKLTSLGLAFVAGVAMLLVLALHSQASAQATATEIKGLGDYAFGMTLREFETAAAKAVKTDKASKPLCTKGSYETTCYMSDLGQSGPPLHFVNFIFSQTAENQKEQDRRLSLIFTNEYKSIAFDKLEPMFVSKYGQPDGATVGTIKSVAGLEYQSREEKWTRGAAILSLSERGGARKVDQMSIVIVNGEYGSFALEMKEKELRDAGKRL
jgi:hypothetical protein